MMQIENLFQIPSLNKNPIKSSVIGVIDSSGSMSSYWGAIADDWNKLLVENPDAIAITFSDNAKIIKGPLTHRIQDYEGSGTEIEKGFRELNTILKSDANIHPNLTILFVSDGCDNNSYSLDDRLKNLSFQIDKTKKCNFLSLAVGRGFPTFVAMRLRDMYHNGDSNLPPVFLIEEPSTQTIKEQFELLTPYLLHRSKCPIKPAVKAFPWSSQPIEIVQEKQWVLTSEKALVLNEDTFEVPAREFIGIQEFIDVIKSWLQELQLLSIKKSVKEEAEIAIEFIKDMKNLYEKKTEGPKKGKMSFYERLMKRSGGDLMQDLNLLIKEIKSFSEENLLSKLSEQEAAKRLAIGTKVGKYHSKAIDLRGISVEDYVKIKQDFMKLLTTFPLSEESSQEPSIISLQNQKEIFLEKDLKDGLSMCPSQYDLVETLPLVGHSIHIYRCDGSMINPWLIQVKSIAKHHKILDTVSIQQNGNEMKLKVGLDDEEIVNAVLPLFDEKDSDLQPYINSKIFHLLMTFNVMQNVDTLYENAYSALLAAATVYLLGRPENEWRNNLLTLINKTIKITYANSLGFKKYVEVLLQEPNLAMVTEHPECPVKCEDLSKPLMVLNYLQMDNKEKLIEIFERIFIELFGRIYVGDASITDYFILEDEHVFDKFDLTPYCEKVLVKYTDEELNKFYTRFELKDDIMKEIAKIDLKIEFDFDIKINKKNIYLKAYKINLELLESLYEQFTKEKINEKNYFLWIYHADSYKNSYERNTSKVVDDLDFILKRVKNKITSEFFKNNGIYKKVGDDLEKRFCKILGKQHEKITPFSETSLAIYCKDHGLNNMDYKFNNCSNLFINACLSPDCPFYMKINNSLAQHLEGDRTLIPAYNKTIKLLKDEEDDEKIYNHILKMDFLDKNLPMPKINEESMEKAEKNKNSILNEIKILKAFYRKES